MTIILGLITLCGLTFCFLCHPFFGLLCINFEISLSLSLSLSLSVEPAEEEEKDIYYIYARTSRNNSNKIKTSWLEVK